MFESLIIMLREGIEASLVIGILLGSLRKMGRMDLAPFVYYGLGLALFGSILGAVLLQFFVVSEEIYEGFLYLGAALFVSTMLYWMLQHSKKLKGEIEQAVERATQEKGARSQKWGLFAFTFFMVFREGIEAVLFLSAVGLTTEKLLSLIGGLLGLALAILFCVAFVKGTVKVDLNRFFKVSTVVLVIFIVQLLINGFHELSEAQILPASQWEMALIGPVVRNNALFILAILSIPILIFLFPSRKKEEISADLEGPQRRLLLAKLKGQKKWRWFWAFTSITIMILLGTHAVYSGRGQTLDPPLLVNAMGEEIRIPFEEVSDEKLHRFAFKDGETLIRFLVIKTEKDHYRTAFDLCEICGDYGYVQEGENVICLNCTAAIYPPTIGVPGGCNPIPLKSILEGEQIVIRKSDLREMSGRFKQKMLPQVECEICRMKLHLEEAHSIEIQGRTFYLCSMDSCRKEFERRASQNTP